MITRRKLIVTTGSGAALSLLGAASSFAASEVAPGKDAEQLDGSKLKSLLSGNSIDGATHKGQLFTIEFREDGVAVKLVEDGRKSTGTWGVEGDSLWYQIPGISNGEKIAMQIWRGTDTPFYKAISDSGKWIAFTVRIDPA